jgi:hypothetical protein
MTRKSIERTITSRPGGVFEDAIRDDRRGHKFDWTMRKVREEPSSDMEMAWFGIKSKSWGFKRQ